jgi:hypothetical protein
MIIYNITIKIEPAIEVEWVNWQKQEHIPEVMSSGFFTDHKFYRLLDQDEADGITYIVQYFSSSIENYKKYIQQSASLFRQKALDKWDNKFIALRTIMQLVN